MHGSTSCMFSGHPPNLTWLNNIQVGEKIKTALLQLPARGRLIRGSTSCTSISHLINLTWLITQPPTVTGQNGNAY